MNRHEKFLLKFDTNPIALLAIIAHCACQKENYGNNDNWILSFEMGKIGLFSKLFGVRRHFYEMHLWGLPNDQVCIEYHISSIFFHMDSSIECFVFMLNSLGYGIDRPLFLDITKADRLKSIKPANIIGIDKNKIVKGYDNYFSELKTFMLSRCDLINLIINHHDVSKHRRSIFTGGQRDVGFIKEMPELSESQIADMVMRVPYDELLLESDPKVPKEYTEGKSCKLDKFEPIVQDYCSFMNNCFDKALIDAQENIILK